MNFLSYNDHAVLNTLFCRVYSGLTVITVLRDLLIVSYDVLTVFCDVLAVLCDVLTVLCDEYLSFLCRGVIGLFVSGIFVC